MKITDDDMLIERCPQFKFCSAPKCPLDPKMKQRNKYPGEPICKLAKSRLKRMAQNYKNELPWIYSGSFFSQRKR